MKTFQEFSEAFNTKVKWTLKHDTKFNNSRSIQVYSGKVETQEIELRYKIEDSELSISFDVNGHSRVTGKGSQMQIFGAVINHIKTYVKENPNLDEIIFSASKAHSETPDGSANPSRSKLYSRLLKKYASKLGFNFKEIDGEHGVVYQLKRLKKLK